ncbi:hypothetical protein VB713_24590, partial [Anabaena cylindrica UHCC 0172]|uniref:hypothetical protein n=1 Tax=Anabaena cylindrica TaxID=1165 RepID=UPI002B1F8072
SGSIPYETSCLTTLSPVKHPIINRILPWLCSIAPKPRATLLNMALLKKPDFLSYWMADSRAGI